MSSISNFNKLFYWFKRHWRTSKSERNNKAGQCGTLSLTIPIWRSQKSVCLCRLWSTVHLFHREQQKFPYILPLRMHVGLFVLQLSSFTQSDTASILYSCLGFGTIYIMSTFFPIFLAKTSVPFEDIFMSCLVVWQFYSDMCIFHRLKWHFCRLCNLFLLYEYNKKESLVL